MELVLLSLDAYGYYSEAEYHEEIWLSRETYEKVKQDIPSEISVGELDGKHSQVFGDVSMFLHNEEDIIAKGNPTILDCDGDCLEWRVKDLLEGKNISYEKEHNDIYSYIDSLDYNITYSIIIPRSLKTDVEVAVNNLLYEYENGVI